MTFILAFIYGLHLVALVYLSAFITVRGLMGSGKVPFYLILAKYFIYWKVIQIGFKSLPNGAILVGLIGGIYLSLPVLYLVNKKYSATPNAY